MLITNVYTQYHLLQYGLA